MEKMSKEQIQIIGQKILLESDIIAKHGTSIANGYSIMETGFNFNKTSMIIQKTDSVVGLCTYGWKENAKGDAANVIISIPKSFIMSCLGYNEQQYSNWINYIKSNDLQETVILSMSDMKIGPLGTFESSLPKESIRGVFIYTDDKNYLSFINNFEEGMNYLTYVDNPSFFENLTEEEQQNFAKKMKEKIGLGSPRS